MKEPECLHFEALFAAQEHTLLSFEPLTQFGLALNLRLESPKLLTWLKTYMNPIFREPESGAELSAFDLDFVYADDIVQYAAELVETHGAGSRVPRSTSSTLEVLGMGSHTYLMVELSDGLVYLVDKQAHSIKVAYSSKTRRPGKALVNVVVEVMTRFLEGQGYCQYHAGAFVTERGAVVVCGRGGAGKTTLLTAAMMSGAKLIANERCFIKVDESGANAIGFPQLIFAGLGMALAFSGLKRFVYNPSMLLAPQQRHSMTRVEQTPPEKIGALKDKFGMLPGEYCHAVNGSQPQLGGKVVGIIAPQINFELERSFLAPLAERQLQKLVYRNTISMERDKHFRYWLDLGFSGAVPHHLALGKLPGFTLHYQIEDEGIAGLNAPLDTIYDAFGSGRA